MLELAQTNLTIHADRLMDSIHALAAIGQLPDGGVRRIAYSPEDIQARQIMQTWMRDAGMAVRIDAAGNLIGTYPGKYPELPALATGSHIDTVPSGGRYDGVFGVLAGLEMIRVLHDRHLYLNHPVELIIFTDEESSMLGSKAISGQIVSDPEYYRRPDGTDIQTCLVRVGGNWDSLPQAKREPRELAAFVELHVEQGPVLESMGKQVGVVEGIVGQRRYLITVTGRPNHAGTTPMYLRQDALVAASQVVLAINEIGHEPGQQVATVGKLEVWPNAANVVPGQVDMSLDIRDLSAFHLDTLIAQLVHRLEVIASHTHTQITLQPTLKLEPALAQNYIQHLIAQSCDELGLSYTHLPSRASHDAQEMAVITDMGMIFVPSIDGISHSETEYTSPEQCAQGANILLQTFLKLDRYHSQKVNLRI